MEHALTGSVGVTFVQGALVVTVTRDLGDGVLGAIRQAALDGVHRMGARRVVLDLGAVPFLDLEEFEGLRQVAHATIGHQLQRFRDLGGGCHGMERARHQQGSRHRHRSGAMGGDAADDVALADDAEHIAAIVAHQHGADARFGQNAGDRADLVLHTNRDDLTALAAKDAGNGHGRCLRGLRR